MKPEDMRAAMGEEWYARAKLHEEIAQLKSDLTRSREAQGELRQEIAEAAGLASLQAPWEISFEAPRWIIQARGVIGKQAVAYLMGGDYIALAANAHMIAAAPELLASLREVSDMLTGRTDMLAKLHPMMGPAEMAVFERSAAAIAKATGRAP